MNSPNHNIGRSGHIPDIQVLHTTGNTTQSAINTVMNRTNQVSYHFIIAGANFAGHGIVPVYKDGDIFQMVDIANTAWHSGITAAVRNNAIFRNNAHRKIQERAHNPNSYTIGIGFGDMNLNGWRLSEAQITAAIWLINHIQAEVQRLFGYTIPLTRERIIGHNEINPVTRSNCPGNIQWNLIMAGLNAAPNTPDNDPAPPPSTTLPDSVASWARNGVAWAIENSISDGQRPTANITRQEAMQMLFNFYNFLNSSCECTATCDC